MITMVWEKDICLYWDDGLVILSIAVDPILRKITKISKLS